ncbi:hypothetical protein RchiOBHm_Chr2g0147041 [Rosa chinensis]|uniref:Secreted protein n=1 Tax=Rosa chinensis TaxID=74649 RepID=A0A2P6RZ15_ROSCH|nr:hypothetical protein RchiOBHm_Chr2g0147041 [Rosa chinensis]
MSLFQLFIFSNLWHITFASLFSNLHLHQSFLCAYKQNCSFTCRICIHELVQPLMIVEQHLVSNEPPF